MSVHLNRLSFDQWKRVVGCVGRVLADSTKTVDIMVAEELTSQAQLRYLLQHDRLSVDEWQRLLEDKPSFVDVDLDALFELPEARQVSSAGSIGRMDCHPACISIPPSSKIPKPPFSCSALGTATTCGMSLRAWGFKVKKYCYMPFLWPKQGYLAPWCSCCLAL